MTTLQFEFPFLHMIPTPKGGVTTVVQQKRNKLLKTRLMLITSLITLNVLDDVYFENISIFQVSLQT
jgi:hypothetical protein